MAKITPSERSICPHCMTENEEKAPYCSQCGYPLSELMPSENMFHFFDEFKAVSTWRRLIILSLYGGSLLVFVVMLVRAVCAGSVPQIATFSLCVGVWLVYILYFNRMVRRTKKPAGSVSSNEV